MTKNEFITALNAAQISYFSAGVMVDLRSHIMMATGEVLKVVDAVVPVEFEGLDSVEHNGEFIDIMWSDGSYQIEGVDGDFIVVELEDGLLVLSQVEE